jgi:hypothetical protein
MKQRAIQTEIVSTDDVPVLSELAAVADEAAKLESGQVLKFKLPSGVNSRQCHIAIHQRGLRIGCRLSVKSIDDVIYVSRRLTVKRTMPRQQTERDAAIMKAIDDLRSYEDISKEFGITRQRVEQIYVREQADKLSHLPVKDRRQALLEIMAPFIEIAKEPYHCIACKEPMSDGKKGRLCSRCQTTFRTLMLVKSRLKCHINAVTDTSIYALSQAHWYVKRHGVKPEDLRFI